MRISDDCTVMIREIRVKAADSVSLRPSGKYFYKFCLGMPKYMSNGLGLSGGGRVYLSMQNDKTHTMTRDRISDGGTQVTLNESVTKRYNGRHTRQSSSSCPVLLQTGSTSTRARSRDAAGRRSHCHALLKRRFFFEAIFIIVRNYAPPHFIYLLFLFFLYFFMHQLAPNALSHFYAPPHFIYLLFFFFLLFFMYQLTQIPFQNFSVFYVPTVPHPLLTFIPARPARIRTTTQTHNTNPHTHHHTPADTFPRPPPSCRTPNRTTAPYPGLPVVPPYNRTTTPFPGPTDTPLQIQHATPPDVPSYRTTMSYHRIVPTDM